MNFNEQQTKIMANELLENHERECRELWNKIWQEFPDKEIFGPFQTVMADVFRTGFLLGSARMAGTPLSKIENFIKNAAIDTAEIGGRP